MAKEAKKENKYFKFLIIALAIAIIVPQIALAAWWNPFTWNWNIFNWFSKPIPASTLSTVDTSNWKTYKNDKYNFEFKYPESFSVIDDPNGMVDINCNNIIACSDFNITSIKATMPLDQYIKGMLESGYASSVNVSYKPYTLGNMQGYLITILPTDNPNAATSAKFDTNKKYLMKNGDNILIFTYGYIDSKKLSDPQVLYQFQNYKKFISGAEKVNSEVQTLISTVTSTLATANNQTVVNPPINTSTLPNIQEIISQKDPAACKKLVSSMVDPCYEEMATTLNDAKICELIQDRTGDMYNSCYLELAKNLNDPSYCAYVDQADDCYMDIAVDKNDVSVCEKIKYDDEKEFCVERVATAKKDSSICNILPEITSTQACKENPLNKFCGSSNSTITIRELCVQWVNERN